MSSKAALEAFDPAEYLDSLEAIQAYLDEAVATGDPAFIEEALDVIARARLANELEDRELAAIVDERKDQPEVEVDINDLEE